MNAEAFHQLTLACECLSGRATALEATVERLSSMIVTRFDLLTETPLAKRHARKHRTAHTVGGSKLLGAFHPRQEDQLQDGVRQAVRERPMKRRERTSGRAGESSKLLRTAVDPNLFGSQFVRSPNLDA
jgi:hypothetical protein